MAKTTTLLAMRTAVQFQGDFENSPVFTPARIDAIINEGVEEFWDLLLDGRPDTLIKTVSLATVASSDSVALPSDFYRLRLVEILNGADYYPLQKHDIGEAWRYQRGPATPTNFSYRIEPGSGTPFAIGLRIAPTPTAVYTLRVKYFPPATGLATDGSTLDTVNGFDGLIIARTIAKLKGGREGSDSAWWDREAARCEAGMRASVSPDDIGEPMSLSGQAGGSTYDAMYGLRVP